MTHFKYDGEVHDLENLADFLENEVSEDEYKEYINNECDNIEILGVDFEPADVLEQMDEWTYNNEKSKWCEKIAVDNMSSVESLSVGEEFTFDDCDITITICDEEGNTEYKPVTNLTIPEEMTVTPIEDKKYLVQGLTDGEGNKFTLTLGKEDLIALNNALLYNL